MSSRQCTVEQFLVDVAHHKMDVKLDNGLYRHLRFSQPKNSNMWFEIVTWPNCLTINGDMGSWTFSRIEDMFSFFRSNKLKINASYWQEKILSESRFGGPAEKFDLDTFKANVLSHLGDDELSEAEKTEITLKHLMRTCFVLKMKLTVEERYRISNITTLSLLIRGRSTEMHTRITSSGACMQSSGLYSSMTTCIL